MYKKIQLKNGFGRSLRHVGSMNADEGSMNANGPASAYEKGLASHKLTKSNHKLSS